MKLTLMRRLVSRFWLVSCVTVFILSMILNTATGRIVRHRSSKLPRIVSAQIKRFGQLSELASPPIEITPALPAKEPEVRLELAFGSLEDWLAPIKSTLRHPMRLGASRIAAIRTTRSFVRWRSRLFSTSAFRSEWDPPPIASPPLVT